MTKRITLIFFAVVTAFILAFPLQALAAEDEGASPDAATAQTTDEATVDDAAGGAADEATAPDDTTDVVTTETEETKKGIDWRHNWPLLIIIALGIYGGFLTARGEVQRKRQREARKQQELLDESGGE